VIAKNRIIDPSIKESLQPDCYALAVNAMTGMLRSRISLDNSLAEILSGNPDDSTAGSILDSRPAHFPKARRRSALLYVLHLHVDFSRCSFWGFQLPHYFSLQLLRIPGFGRSLQIRHTD
jgi:hypothetical protein